MLRVVIVNLKRDRLTVNRRRVTESKKELRQGETEHKKIMSNHLDAVDYSRLFRCVRLSCFRHSTHTHTISFVVFNGNHYTSHWYTWRGHKCTNVQAHTPKKHISICVRARCSKLIYASFQTESNIYSKFGASKHSYATLFLIDFNWSWSPKKLRIAHIKNGLRQIQFHRLMNTWHRHKLNSMRTNNFQNSLRNGIEEGIQSPKVSQSDCASWHTNAPHSTLSVCNEIQ